MSIASPVPAPTLRPEHVDAMLDASVYRSTAVRLAGTRLLSPGCAVSLQLGDQVALDAGGEMGLTIRGSLRINGAARHAVGATYWQIRRPPHRPAGSHRFSFALETDLILASGVVLADVVALGGEAFRHLHRLIADGRETLLHELPIDTTAPDDAPGPALRIEARLLGDLVSGRSGLVAAGGTKISARHQRITSAACDWLIDEVLPELARAFRAVICQASSSQPSGGASGDRAAGPHPTEIPSPVAAPTGNADCPSIIPELVP